MILRRLGLAALVLLAGAYAHAAEPRLNAQATVDDEVVTLGDLFDNAGDAGETIVARAPAPGQRMALGVAHILGVARSNGLAWQPPHGLKRVIVSRASRRIPRRLIELRIREALADTAPDRNLRVEPTNRTLEIHVATAAPATVAVESIAFDPRTGRFAAAVVAAPGTRFAVRTEVAGRAVEVVEIPVLTRGLRRDEVIGADDIEWIERPVDRLSAAIVTDAADLLGMQLRRSLRAGRPIRARDVRPPVVVAKGAKVIMVYRTENMMLTVTGRALGSGAMGETISVLNAQSKIVVEAVVEGGNVVSVAAPRRFAMN